MGAIPPTSSVSLTNAAYPAGAPAGAAAGAAAAGAAGAAAGAAATNPTLTPTAGDHPEFEVHLATDSEVIIREKGGQLYRLTGVQLTSDEGLNKKIGQVAAKKFTEIAFLFDVKKTTIQNKKIEFEATQISISDPAAPAAPAAPLAPGAPAPAPAASNAILTNTTNQVTYQTKIRDLADVATEIQSIYNKILGTGASTDVARKKANEEAQKIIDQTFLHQSSTINASQRRRNRPPQDLTQNNSINQNDFRRSSWNYEDFQNGNQFSNNDEDDEDDEFRTYMDFDNINSQRNRQNLLNDNSDI